MYRVRRTGDAVCSRAARRPLAVGVASHCVVQVDVQVREHENSEARRYRLREMISTGSHHKRVVDDQTDSNI